MFWILLPPSLTPADPSPLIPPSLQTSWLLDGNYKLKRIPPLSGVLANMSGVLMAEKLPRFNVVIEDLGSKSMLLVVPYFLLVSYLTSISPPLF